MPIARACCASFIVLSTALTAARAEPPTPRQLQEILQQVQQDPARFERLLRQANDMQACLSQLAPETMDTLRVRGEEMVADIRALCVAGERDMAASRAVQYAQEMAASPDLRAIEACGNMAAQLVADLPFATRTASARNSKHRA